MTEPHQQRRRPRRAASRRRGWAATIIVLVLAWVTAAIAGTSSPAVASAPAPRSTMVPPSSFGPYRVGRQVITITSHTGRSRTIDVWYPANATATGRLSTYVGPAFSGLASTGRALDRVPVAKGGPFPLVVYSHGSGAMRFIATFFTETLASHGFVVISADHTGDTISDVFAGHPSTPGQEPQIIASRAADVRMIVSVVLTRSATRGDLLYKAVDARRIGITGHSYGGLTAFATVSGRTSSDGHAIPRDARFKAIVTMDATWDLLVSTDLAHVTIPTLSIVGEDMPPGGASFWYQTRSSPFLELRINRADHNVFTDICLYQRLLPEQPHATPAAVAYINATANATCRPPHLGADAAHLLTNRYAIAFLLVHLAGDQRYASYLIPAHGTEFDLTRPTLGARPPDDTTPLP